MRVLFVIGLTAVALGLGGLGGYHWGRMEQNSDIAGTALIGINNAVRIKTAIHSGKALEMGNLNLIDVGIYQDLYRMQSFESSNPSDTSYLNVRSRTIVALKKLWLIYPPYALDEPQKRYVESVCRLSAECPAGELVPRTPALHLNEGK